MPINSRFRYFNKHFTNHLTGLIAGRKYSPIALVTHVGRRSGKTYTTPILAERSQEGFIFALTYGLEVDWYRNVQAAGQCRLKWRGKEYHLVQPQCLDQTSGMRAFPNPQRFVLKWLKIEHYFVMIAAKS